MNVTLIAVISVDGKTTKWGDPNIYKWTSQEDHDNFFSHVESNNFIVMGSKTYEAARSVIRISNNRLTLVLTRNPEKYKNATIPGQLEFTSQNPEAIIKEYEGKFENLLLTSGGEINTLFFRSKLINRIILTIEPYLFGEGNNILENTKLDINLSLNSVKQLNKKGTLLLDYSVTYK